MVRVRDIEIDNNKPFTLIAGPCAIESIDHCLNHAHEIQKIAKKLSIPFIFKSSFDKANRTSINSKRGVGIIDGMAVLSCISEAGIPVITDIHTPEQAVVAKDAGIDVLQIPAFLCRQTDLLVAAGETELPINIKKAQFLSPEEMKNVVEKIESTGNKNIMVCERGTLFGYNNLVVDYRSIPIMRSFGYPVVMDSTHSVQRPGGNGESSGGDRTFIPTLAKAAVVNKVAAVFMEVHEKPNEALSDASTQWPLNELEVLLKELKAIDRLVKNY